jgi:hypothetical protein
LKPLRVATERSEAYTKQIKNYHSICLDWSLDKNGSVLDLGNG